MMAKVDLESNLYVNFSYIKSFSHSKYLECDFIWMWKDLETLVGNRNRERLLREDCNDVSMQHPGFPHLSLKTLLRCAANNMTLLNERFFPTVQVFSFEEPRLNRKMCTFIEGIFHDRCGRCATLCYLQYRNASSKIPCHICSTVPLVQSAMFYLQDRAVSSKVPCPICSNVPLGQKCHVLSAVPYR
jgi:hypothetical protein